MASLHIYCILSAVKLRVLEWLDLESKNTTYLTFIVQPQRKQYIHRHYIRKHNMIHLQTNVLLSGTWHTQHYTLTTNVTIVWNITYRYFDTLQVTHDIIWETNIQRAWHICRKPEMPQVVWLRFRLLSDTLHVMYWFGSWSINFVIWYIILRTSLQVHSE